MIISYFAWAAAVTGFCALAMVGRLIAGPTVPDRVVALDQIAIIIVCIIICDTIYSGMSSGLDVALVVSLLLVIGSMIIARFLHKRRSDND